MAVVVTYDYTYYSNGDIDVITRKIFINILRQEVQIKHYQDGTPPETTLIYQHEDFEAEMELADIERRAEELETDIEKYLEEEGYLYEGETLDDLEKKK